MTPAARVGHVTPVPCPRLCSAGRPYEFKKFTEAVPRTELRIASGEWGFSAGNITALHVAEMAQADVLIGGTSSFFTLAAHLCECIVVEANPHTYKLRSATPETSVWAKHIQILDLPTAGSRRADEVFAAALQPVQPVQAPAQYEDTAQKAREQAAEGTVTPAEAEAAAAAKAVEQSRRRRRRRRRREAEAAAAAAAAAAARGAAETTPLPLPGWKAEAAAAAAGAEPTDEFDPAFSPSEISLPPADPRALRPEYGDCWDCE